MKKFLIITTIIVAVLFVPFLLAPESEASKVYKVCNESRQVIDGALEQKCGDMQDATNTEFLCDGLEAESHCWVEKK